jgi:hypothetical protein
VSETLFLNKQRKENILLQKFQSNLSLSEAQSSP